MFRCGWTGSASLGLVNFMPSVLLTLGSLEFSPDSSGHQALSLVFSTLLL